MVVRREPTKRDKRVPRARTLRRAVTIAERKLWWHLKRLPLPNSHFRRQATIGPFFVDFACHEQRIVIEVDGGQHNDDAQHRTDQDRTVYLTARGYRVLRFWNNEVLENIEGVLEIISLNMRAIPQALPPTPDPSPPRSRAGGGERPQRRAPSRRG